MSATAFIVDNENRLTELKREPYESELLLQHLLSDHPALLGRVGSGDGRLLLIKHELAVPDGESNGQRWSLDHLFVDCEGVPILVEVKRASDTRARREVVAQMLDYAANGVAYWAIEKVIAAFESSSPDPEAALAAFLDNEEADPFWRKIEANLRAGRIRMVFVADRIPAELRRIVEFLNEQMRPAEVLAIELDQHMTRDGLRLLTPTLLGATERAAAVKSVSHAPIAMDEDEWLAALSAQHSAEHATGARRCIEWLRANGFDVDVSKSSVYLIASLRSPDGAVIAPFYIRRTTGMLETSLPNLRSSSAFSGEQSCQELLSQLRELSSGKIKTKSLNGWPAISLSIIGSDEAFLKFAEIALAVRDRLRMADV